jgi:hypothetical protein
MFQTCYGKALCRIHEDFQRPRGKFRKRIAE